MYRGTTPTIEIKCDFNVNTIETLFITFVQKNETIFEKSLSDCEIQGETIVCHLTQDDTLKLEATKRDNGAKDWLEIQTRCRLKTGETLSSPINKVEVEKILKDGVI